MKRPVGLSVSNRAFYFSLAFILFLSALFLVQPPARAFDWRAKALENIDQLRSLIQQAGEVNLTAVKNYWSELRPSISGFIPWIDPFLGSDNSTISGYEDNLQVAQTLFERREYVAIFKVLRLNFINSQLAAAIAQRRLTITKIQDEIQSAVTPPAKLRPVLAALQKKYWDKLNSVISPKYLPEIHPSQIRFLDHQGQTFFYVEFSSKVNFDAAQTNQNSRIAGNFNIVITDLLMGDIPLTSDFDGYILESTYFRIGPKNSSGSGIPETVDYVMFNDQIKKWRALKITSQELIDNSIILLTGKRLKIDLLQGVE